MSSPPLQFVKMHGAGNDYVYVDCFRQAAPADPAATARAIADRHFGVGGDGLILIGPVEGADAEMRMYNADGSYSEMCGNGIRCVAKYVYDSGLARSNPLRIASGGRVFTLDLALRDDRVDRVRVDMGQPVFDPELIPTQLAGVPPVEVELAVAGRTLAVTCVSMGNPHCVTFVERATDELVLGLGPHLETHGVFPKRTNVEFVEVVDRGKLRQRTWERGSGETLACGTGACAVCVAGVLTGRSDRRVTIQLRGGDLEIEWNEADGRVFMTGGAVEVFRGEWRQT
jgi:diaminopimelate epimerase